MHKYNNYNFGDVVNNAEKIINENVERDFSFKTKDEITVVVKYDLYLNYASMEFSKNKLKLKTIEFSCGRNYVNFVQKTEIIELSDGFKKRIKTEGDYTEEIYYKEENSKILFFRPDGPAVCCISKNGFVVSASYYLFGKIVRKKEYDDFIEKVKNGHFIKNINRIKDKDKIEHIYYAANFYGIDKLIEKSKNRLMTINILAKLEGGEQF